jgi:hypothetical protein
MDSNQGGKPVKERKVWTFKLQMTIEARTLPTAIKRLDAVTANVIDTERFVEEVTTDYEAEEWTLTLHPTPKAVAS